ncbi:hypothetical protein KIN20_023372 [Parelaphostrongylus tenuis]|uniref:Uncharacterized protein n=1 Tax=Parelaphostrongylus tenuis TaxID=148309 RepID=A0AAD5QVC6_PARTN|nr:hypothetical protein KIN20_023372 [Parelaphostrongylus tenuis]
MPLKDELQHENKLQSIKSTELKSKAQQTILLLDAGLSVLIAGNLDLEDKPHSGDPTRLNIIDLIADLENEPQSKPKECCFDRIRNKTER